MIFGPDLGKFKSVACLCAPARLRESIRCPARQLLVDYRFGGAARRVLIWAATAPWSRGLTVPITRPVWSINSVVGHPVTE